MRTFDWQADMAAPSSRNGHPSSQAAPLRVGLVGTYPPRCCGLATFTADVAMSLRSAGHHVTVVALVDGDEYHNDDIDHRLHRRDPDASHDMAATLSREVDVVLIQHEFGIFGGRNGALLGELTERLTVPYALTLHTVTGSYTPGQRAALAAPLAGAAAVLLFSPSAVDLLTAQFPDLATRCQVVPHGAPVELYRPRTTGLRHSLSLPDHAKVVTTFGLLSPGKGVEHTIAAMSTVAERVPDATLVIAGQTHPEVTRRHGEQYRESLVSLAHQHGVDDVVVFRDWFHDVQELSTLLISSDVFVTAYTGAEQIVSGALSFAIAAGLPFVSTPYRYAVEMASRGCGVTTAFGDDDSLATAMTMVLTDDLARQRMAKASRSVASTLSWPQVGSRIGDVLAATLASTQRQRERLTVSTLIVPATTEPATSVSPRLVFRA
jgi:glycosyltransferase involved in cell wall biosynthesis